MLHCMVGVLLLNLKPEKGQVTGYHTELTKVDYELKMENKPKSEKPHPRTSIAQTSKPASSSNGYAVLHSKQELKDAKYQKISTTEKYL